MALLPERAIVTAQVGLREGLEAAFAEIARVFAEHLDN
jgi:hypothetical protein